MDPHFFNCFHGPHTSCLGHKRKENSVSFILAIRTLHLAVRGIYSCRYSDQNTVLTDTQNGNENQVCEQFSQCRLDVHFSIRICVFGLTSSPEAWNKMGIPW